MSNMFASANTAKTSFCRQNFTINRFLSPKFYSKYLFKLYVIQVNFFNDFSENFIEK